MCISRIPFDDLSAYFGRTVEDLKTETYLRLEALTEQMKQEKAKESQKRNAKDKEFQRIVKKYFTMWDFLRKWWTKEELILAISRQAEVKDLVSELEVRQNASCHDPKGEYITTRMGYLPRYTKNGEELARREYTRCDVYRIPNQYQTNVHGRIILDLLYGRYPELKAFDFKAYGWYGYERPGSTKNSWILPCRFMKPSSRPGETGWRLHKMRSGKRRTISLQDHNRLGTF